MPTELNSNNSESIFKPPVPGAEQEIINRWNEGADKPLVSIICHTYQHVNYLRDALNGFLMQETSFSFEVILRDDASVDGTKEIVEEYASRYPSIIKPVIETENQFSKGIKPATVTFPLALGRYIAFCEGDDYWCDHKKLAKQVSFLEENGDYVVTYHDAVVIDEKNMIERRSILCGKHIDYSQEKLLTCAMMPNLTRCYRNVIKEFPEEYKYVSSGDTFMTSLLGQHGKAKCMTNILPAVYRRHGGGIWAGVDESRRRINSSVTFYWLAVYYKRINMNRVAQKQAFSSVMTLSAHLGLTWFSMAKIFLYKILNK
ncbi:MAG: glycosyltransferase [Candidatus Sedimenticola sp. (ex Thyasira tokunagai)]